MRRNKAGETGVDVARAVREAEAEAARVAEEERRRAEEERLKKEAEVAAFARALAELGLHADDRDGGPVEVPPQALAAPVGGAAGRADSAFEPSTNPPLGRVPDAPAPSPAPAPPPPVERPSATSSYEIDPKHLQQGGFLGRGGFGMVMEGTYQKHTKVALKMINDGAGLSGRQLQKAVAGLEQEMEVWSRLPYHANVLPLMGWCREPLCLVTLLMSGGTAKRYLGGLRPTPWEPRAVHRLLFQVALGMHHLHSRPTPILHVDLKGDNILVDENGVAKVSDFGMSRIRATASLQSTKGQGGTPMYMAPELFVRPRPKPGTPTDVYAFGMTMWELLSEGDTPLLDEIMDE
ncbi:kinase-like domain-containing protein, partial [Hyaloraphidium curvatum]